MNLYQLLKIILKYKQGTRLIEFIQSHKKRRAITDILNQTEKFHSAQELYDELRQNGLNIGLTTVYRTLQVMTTSGVVDTIRTDRGELVYRRCSDNHHHHLICRICGATIEVSGHYIENWTTIMASVHGFSNVSHTIEIFGICGSCGSCGSKN